MGEALSSRGPQTGTCVLVTPSSRGGLQPPPRPKRATRLAEGALFHEYHVEGPAARPCYHNQPQAPGRALCPPTSVSGAGRAGRAGSARPPPCWARPQPPGRRRPLSPTVTKAESGAGAQPRLLRRRGLGAVWRLGLLPRGFLPQVCEPQKHLPTCRRAGWGTPTPLANLVLAGVVEPSQSDTHSSPRRLSPVGLAAARVPGRLEQQGPRQGEHTGGQARDGVVQRRPLLPAVLARAVDVHVARGVRLWSGRPARDPAAWHSNARSLHGRSGQTTTGPGSAAVAGHQVGRKGLRGWGPQGRALTGCCPAPPQPSVGPGWPQALPFPTGVLAHSSTAEAETQKPSARSTDADK